MDRVIGDNHIVNCFKYKIWLQTHRIYFLDQTDHDDHLFHGSVMRWLGFGDQTRCMFNNNTFAPNPITIDWIDVFSGTDLSTAAQIGIFRVKIH